MDIILLLQSAIMGIIQGITEWLPISSTGHLILFNEVIDMKVSKEFFEMFKVVIQFGSILAVVVLYWSKLNPFGRCNQSECYKITNLIGLKKSTINLYLKVLVGVIPAGVIGVLFDDVIENFLSGSVVIAITLIFYGIVFIVIESRKKEPKHTDLDKLSYKNALGIGTFQILALIPGTSRSGSTIIGGSLLGCSRQVAAEFSFFLAIPVMLGASLLKLLKFGFEFTNTEWLVLVVGMVVSFLVSVLAIKFLMGYIRKHDFKGFGIYRIILGIIILITVIV